MKKYTVLLIIFLLIPKLLMAEEILINIEKRIVGSSTVICGSTNLPEGTKLGISLTKGGKSGPQDYKIRVKNGFFESQPMTIFGNRLDDSFTVHIFTYFNQIWQPDPSIREELKKYTSNYLQPEHGFGLKFEVKKRLGDI